MHEIVTPERFLVNTGLKIRIEDFCAATKEVKVEHTKHQDEYKIRFSVSVFPNGVDEETEGWLVVLPEVKEHNLLRTPDNGALTWILNIIDIEGNFKFPRSFSKLPSDEVVDDPKYLQRSFIFKRADEFLSEGALTLHCDISFDSDRIKTRLLIDYRSCAEAIFSTSSHDFLPSIPKVRLLRNGGDPENPSDTFIVYDFTFQILTLPQFHGLRRRFGVYGVSPRSSPSGSKADSTYIMEHVWIFDTDSDRFLLCLDEGQKSVGARLLEESPVIGVAVNTPTREHFEKRYVFSNVKSQTLKLVLFFLEHETFPSLEFHEVVGIYKFAHMYDMPQLQEKCTGLMVEGYEIHTVFEEIKKIADLYEDEYLSELSNSRFREYESFRWKLPLSITENTLPSPDWYR